MFGILSATFKTATREDLWASRHERDNSQDLMSGLDRHATGATGRWRAPQTWVRD